MSARKYFGTDGVRGKVGEAPITPEVVMHLGFAAGEVLSKEAPPGSHAAVLIGKDTRISGYLLESALQAGLAAAGVDVWLAGPMPTPAISYLTRALRLSAGVVISASHNPYDDNGIKFFGANGHKLPDEVERRIEERLDAPMHCKPSAQLGKARRVLDADGRYIEFCKSSFPFHFNLRGLKIVLDCANGAAYQVGPSVFTELGAEVIKLACAPDGLNINHECGSTHPETLQQAVVEHEADLGIAFDGDSDRVLMVDRHGQLVDGDELIVIIAQERMATGNGVKGVVGTLMSNLGMEIAVREMGLEFVRAKVGDRYVMAELQSRGWTLGGEASGHILCLDKTTTGDAIIAALQVLSAMVRTHKPLHELRGGMQKLPQVLINVRVGRRSDPMMHSPVVAAVKAAEERLADRGRVLLRASGTEPLIRVMVEGADQSLVATLAEELAGAVAVAMA